MEILSHKSDHGHRCSLNSLKGTAQGTAGVGSARVRNRRTGCRRRWCAGTRLSGTDGGESSGCGQRTDGALLGYQTQFPSKWIFVNILSGKKNLNFR